MRAKMEVSGVEKFDTGEKVSFRAVGKSGSYPEDGSDEDNTFAKFTPSGDASFYIANPALLGKFETGQKFYVDFTPVSETRAPMQANASVDTSNTDADQYASGELPPGAGDNGSNVEDVRVDDGAPKNTL